jgi:hypothetical protein
MHAVDWQGTPGSGEDIDAAHHAVARVDRKFYFLGSHFEIPFFVRHPQGRAA